METTIKVSGMGCENCVHHVTRALEGIPGIKNVKVDLQTGEVTFDNPDAVSMEKISAIIEEAGYEVAK